MLSCLGMRKKEIFIVNLVGVGYNFGIASILALIITFLIKVLAFFWFAIPSNWGSFWDYTPLFNNFNFEPNIWDFLILDVEQTINIIICFGLLISIILMITYRATQKSIDPKNLYED